jgi:hypothetical protein
MTQGLLLSLASMQALFDSWRALGSRRLRNGTELITRIPDDDGFAWMHVLYPRLDGPRLQRLERSLGRSLPRDLCALYGVVGGMSLFGGMFKMHAHRRPYVHEWEDSLQPPDLGELNHELTQFAWKRDEMLAFAVNSWDLSVHVYGMGSHPSEVVRVERASGAITERHPNVWALLDAKLHRIDELMVQ